MAQDIFGNCSQCVGCGYGYLKARLREKILLLVGQTPQLSVWGISYCHMSFSNGYFDSPRSRNIGGVERRNPDRSIHLFLTFL